MKCAFQLENNPVKDGFPAGNIDYQRVDLDMCLHILVGFLIEL